MNPAWTLSLRPVLVVEQRVADEAKRRVESSHALQAWAAAQVLATRTRLEAQLAASQAAILSRMGELSARIDALEGQFAADRAAVTEDVRARNEELGASLRAFNEAFEDERRGRLEREKVRSRGTMKGRACQRLIWQWHCEPLVPLRAALPRVGALVHFNAAPTPPLPSHRPSSTASRPRSTAPSRDTKRSALRGSKCAAGCGGARTRYCPRSPPPPTPLSQVYMAAKARLEEAVQVGRGANKAVMMWRMLDEEEVKRKLA